MLERGFGLLLMLLLLPLPLLMPTVALLSHVVADRR
jgi:hypothetical protein